MKEVRRQGDMVAVWGACPWKEVYRQRDEMVRVILVIVEAEKMKGTLR